MVLTPPPPKQYDRADSEDYTGPATQQPRPLNSRTDILASVPSHHGEKSTAVAENKVRKRCSIFIGPRHRQCAQLVQKTNTGLNRKHGQQ